MLSEEGDVSLVVSAQKGDRAAYSALFQRHEAMLRALCRRTLANVTQVDDVVQEAALQAMLNLDRLQDKERFGPWLSGIGLNLCRRWLRERSQPLRADWSWEVLSGGRWVPEPEAAGADPQHIAEEADLADRVRRAVADLPRGQRSSVLLFYLAGLTYAETAAQLGIEVSAVRTRLHKARRTLRRQLDELWKETMMEESIENENARPVRVADVRRQAVEGEDAAHYVVILEDLAGGSRLGIWIGQSEASAVALQLEKAQWPRPQTYAFTANLLQAVGGRLREVIITKLDDAEVYYAVAVVEGSRKHGRVDARPSDAINLALSMGAPIRVEPSVFDAAEAARAKEKSTPDAFAEGTQGAREIVADIEAHWTGPGRLTRQPT